jgi:hypothetical protein
LPLNNLIPGKEKIFFLKKYETYNQGTALVSEDSVINHLPYCLGVADGVSGIYNPKEGPRLFNYLTGGQLACQSINREFRLARMTKDSLGQILGRADNFLYDMLVRNEIDVDNSEMLPSAAFCIAKMEEERVQIVKGADCFAVWKEESGRCGGTPNQMFDIEQSLRETIAFFRAKYKNLPAKESIEKMWEEFSPILIESRRKFVNKSGGYSIINGQGNFYQLMQKFSLEKGNLKYIVMFTDGFLPFVVTKDPDEMASYVTSRYERDRLGGVLAETYRRAEEEKEKSHTFLPEATAIAVRF